MEKRYQVFVSSTYQDLQEERQEIMQALLELDCIPAGMELFPAANDDQWTLIKRVIDDCDYYIVVIGNRYGTIGIDGLSYTQMEYNYALECRKPVIGFVHRAPTSLPVDRSETNPNAVAALDEFRALVKKKAVRTWESPKELGSVVSRAIIQLIKNNPAVGWVRADAAAAELAGPEILRLRAAVDELAQQLKAAREEAPASASDLAQGEDVFTFNITLECYDRNVNRKTFYYKMSLSWNRIFNAIGPYLMDELTELSMQNKLELGALNALTADKRVSTDLADLRVSTHHISQDDFQTIKVQLIALGLIRKSVKERSVKNNSAYWTLTPYGESTLSTLRAVRRPARTNKAGRQKTCTSEESSLSVLKRS